MSIDMPARWHRVSTADLAQQVMDDASVWLPKYRPTGTNPVQRQWDRFAQPGLWSVRSSFGLSRLICPGRVATSPAPAR